MLFINDLLFNTGFICSLRTSFKWNDYIWWYGKCSIQSSFPNN